MGAGGVGGFHIDPWRPVKNAVITHGHSDHARRGSSLYIATPQSAPILRHRLGKDINLREVPYGETFTLNGMQVSLHPAGHLLGSAQVRVEHEGQVWVVTGDYKRAPDPTCDPFEVVPCDVLISECTFGLPIYQWPDPAEVINDINDWWRHCQTNNRTAILTAYSLGKAQRLLASIDATIGPIGLHGAIAPLCQVYRDAGIHLPEWVKVDRTNAKQLKGQALVIAPPSALGTPWPKQLAPVSAASASGWMRVRGRRRREALDRGFVLSDHADWPALIRTFKETGAKRIGLTHGATEALQRYLIEVEGLDAYSIDTSYVGEGADEATTDEAETDPQGSLT
ncbi:ligase-associated DNA damage response exonuclease [Mucisphaera sp.]|uniref:ligase-associated DNA damage response exonuclease n=1 Tax=Mucisphaera sp. TaxID=2913024 RepID=UPI003D0B5B17